LENANEGNPPRAGLEMGKSYSLKLRLILFFYLKVAVVLKWP
jgi:hypothetical protein